MAFTLHIIAITAMTITHVLGYNLIFGKGKIFHFGPLGTSVVTAYTCFVLLERTGSFWIAIPAAFAAAMLISVFFAWLSFRLDPDGLGIMTIAVHLGLIAVVLNLPSVTRGAMGIPRIPRMPGLESAEAFAIALVIIAALWLGFLLWLERSAYGRQLDALAENEWHAKSLGVHRFRVHLIAFLLCGFGAVITNVFYHQYLFLLHPSDFGFANFLVYLTIVVAGKPGSMLGTTIACILLVLLKEGLRFIELPTDILGPTRLLLFGVILLAAVWWRRDSLFPKKRTI